MVVEETNARRQVCCNMPKSCEGSRCMAWVWKLETDPKTMLPPNVFVVPIIRSTTHGYCGLVGE